MPLSPLLHASVTNEAKARGAQNSSLAARPCTQPPGTPCLRVLIEVGGAEPLFKGTKPDCAELGLRSPCLMLWLLMAPTKTGRGQQGALGC